MLKGKNITLRAVEKQDLASIARWRNDPRVLHSFFSPFLINPCAQEQWYENLQGDPTRLITMIDLNDGKTVGMIGLDGIDYQNQQAEIAFLLIDPDVSASDRVSEACFMLTRYAFSRLNMHRIYAIAYAERFSADWFEIAGYKKEVVLRRSVFSRGKYHDKVMWGVLRDDWLSAYYGNEDGSKVEE
jgi:RimJ/RimL family protein N-acetyltransferase